MASDFARHLRCFVAVALVGCAVAGCGRDGSLEPPPKADVNKTRASQAADNDTQVKDPTNTGSAAQETQEAQSSTPNPAGGLTAFKAKKPPPIKPPKEPFFLDPLLQ